MKNRPFRGNCAGKSSTGGGRKTVETLKDLEILESVISFVFFFVSFRQGDKLGQGGLNRGGVRGARDSVPVV